MTKRLRVATLNIWNKSGPWLERLRLIRRDLRELEPDLLGLQEVLRFSGKPPSSESCQAVEIAEGQGYEVAYGAAQDYGGGMSFGNALCSRHPIVEQRVEALPGAESGETRSLLYCKVQHPEGVLPVFVTHLNWKLHHGQVRERQVRHLVDCIFEWAPTSAGFLPPVLMGDFNAEPDSDEMRFMRGLCCLENRSAYFADAWIYAGDGGGGHTYHRENTFAGLAHEPPRRIDYIYVRGPDRKFRGEPLETRLAFHRPEAVNGEQVWPSDHYGLVTELALTPRDS